MELNPVLNWVGFGIIFGEVSETESFVNLKNLYSEPHQRCSQTKTKNKTKSSYHKES
jgi:hypothetical protein